MPIPITSDQRSPFVQAEDRLGNPTLSPFQPQGTPAPDILTIEELEQLSIPELLTYLTGDPRTGLTDAANQQELANFQEQAGTQQQFTQQAFDLGTQGAETQAARDLRDLSNNFAARGLGNSGFRERGLRELSTDQALGEAGRGLQFRSSTNQLNSQVQNAMTDFAISRSLLGLTGGSGR